MTALATLAEQARAYASQAHAPNTIRAYRSDWRHFAAWCGQSGVECVPAKPETVALYITHLANAGRASYATIQRRLATIAQAHAIADFVPVPTRTAPVQYVLDGIRRRLGVAHLKAKRPVLVDELRLMLEQIPSDLMGLRDRALLLVGFAGAFRRSELVGIDVDHLENTPKGLIVTLLRRKNDQDGKGSRIAIPLGSNGADTCPVRAIGAWLEVADITAGPVFRSCQRGRLDPRRLSGAAVSLILKRHCRSVGLDESSFAAHSLRSGFVTSAAIAGKSERSIQEQTGHRSLTVMRNYIREGELRLFRDNAAKGLL